MEGVFIKLTNITAPNSPTHKRCSLVDKNMHNACIVCMCVVRCASVHFHS
ncbi:hypothetical protein PAHAL_5G193400 [Panicum hallii]|uniref:Uncharacterized protein n=1 Tax=Panicum hallii TaxID=206008 RepID=A0A2T8IKH3_9POAL|nr:hypothetical protein PAHAL_5G193400 [Panicum hallii]